MGHLSFVYLDDGLGSQPDKISAHAASIIQRQDLRASGSLCNEGKSHWTPMQVGEWGLHSIKSGAASNPGCRLLNSDILDRHAGWNNPASKNRYIENTVNDLLQVTKSLGL